MCIWKIHYSGRLTHKHFVRLEKSARNKHFSLSGPFESYKEKIVADKTLVFKILIGITILFMFSKLLKIRHLCQLQRFIFQHRCLICNLSLIKILSKMPAYMKEGGGGIIMPLVWLLWDVLFFLFEQLTFPGHSH